LLQRDLQQGPRTQGIEIASSLRVEFQTSHTSQDQTTPAREGVPKTPELRSPHASERSALLDWLNAGLRPGKPNRLQREFPTALDDPDLDLHSVVKVGNQFVSHAFARVVEVCANGCTLSFGMIGLVYTDPAFRGKHYASSCVSRCLEKLRERNVPLAGLWSEQQDFYRHLGFEAAGQEIWFSISTEDCIRARTGQQDGLQVGPPQDCDWAELESLYNQKPLRAIRQAGELRRLANAPETRLVVARNADRVLAYAALGRGDDFPRAVHEWAGQADGVLACLEALVDRGNAIAWLTGPAAEAPVQQLQKAGAVPVPGHFALLRLLDAEAVWAAIHKDPSDAHGCRLAKTSKAFLFSTPDVELELTHLEALHLLFGPTLPPRAQSLISGVSTPEDSSRLPWPLFLWGFDSN
jgi:GNAT superfamily N-acetyltransferase